MRNTNLTKKLYRRVTWFFKSGVLSLSVEHFLAMFPATILVPMLINSRFNTDIIDVALVLFTSGLGTLAFIILSKGKIPAYIGSSFAFIGLTIFLISSQENDNITPKTAYLYVCWSYIFSGMFLILLSLIYKYKNIDKILSFLLPAPIVGPAISLIGLELADTAASDSGFQIGSSSINTNSIIIAVSTLVIIIIMSLTRRKYLKNAAIIAGIAFGYIVSIILNKSSFPDITEVALIKLPRFQFFFMSVPPNMFNLFISVIPATLIVFLENIGRVTIITRMTTNNNDNQPIFNDHNLSSFSKSISSHGVATLIAGVLGSVPNTIYAENIAVMGIHSAFGNEKNQLERENDKFVKLLCEPFSYVPIVIAAIIALFVSFIGALQTILLSIPKPVIGGVELFLFGIISAPGIQLLVDQQVNYKKISNQVLTASVLITGVSGLTVSLGVVELKGMSLGFTIGLILNLLVRFLNLFGRLDDAITFDELLEFCIQHLPSNKVITGFGNNNSLPTLVFGLNSVSNTTVDFNGITSGELMSIFSGNREWLSINSKNSSTEISNDVIKNWTSVAIGDGNHTEIKIQKTLNSLYLLIKISCISSESLTEYLNDYRGIIDIDSSDYMRIPINGDVPMRVVKKLLQSFV